MECAEAETLASVHELYAWAGIEGDGLDPRSVRGVFHWALGSPSSIGDLAFVSGPGLECVFRGLRAPALSADIPERPPPPLGAQGPVELSRVPSPLRRYPRRPSRPRSAQAFRPQLR